MVRRFCWPEKVTPTLFGESRMTLRATGYMTLLVSVFAYSAYAQDKADEKAPLAPNLLLL